MNMQQQIAEISLDLGFRQRRTFHFGIEIEFFLKSNRGSAIAMTVHVRSEFFFKRVIARLKSFLKRIVNRDVRAQEIEKLGHLRDALFVVRLKQKMNQQP